MDEFEVTCGVAYKIYKNVQKGNTTSKNVVRFKYSINGKIYDKSAEFYTWDVNEGDIYRINVSKKDPSVHTIIFDQKYKNCQQIMKGYHN